MLRRQGAAGKMIDVIADYAPHQAFGNPIHME
jgi:hypothetical protein